MRSIAVLVAVCVLLPTAACENPDYPSLSRRISDDIDVTQNVGPTAGRPGMTRGGEPLGVYPWNMGERR